MPPGSPPPPPPPGMAADKCINPIVFLCNISDIPAMYQIINVEAAEIVDVMQREKNRILGRSIIIITSVHSIIGYIAGSFALWPQLLSIWEQYTQ